MKTIGFFGGSFDPIHFGHLNLAIQMLEKGGVDEILFCPAFCSPFKTNAPPFVSGQHRLEMIRRVIMEVPQFRVTSMEIERNEPSFTIDTLRLLPHEGVKYRLILSEEAMAQFGFWKEPGEILRLAPPLVGMRAGRTVPQGFPVVSMPLFDIASTEIRERFKKNFYCGHLVPRIALDYIREHQLY